MIDKYLTKNYFLHQKISSEKIEKIYGKNFNYLLGNLLYARNIKKEENVRIFLNPQWEENHNPFLFNQMEDAVKRIFKAIKNKEKILIFSDYDTDGIPGGAILYNFFKKINYENFLNFIPNRNKDGYGLTLEVVKKIIAGSVFEGTNFEKDAFNKNFIKEEKSYFIPDLVITIDCGITDLDSATILKKSKIDLIITDHHLAKEKLPHSIAILNPKVPKEKYPEKNLCGAGVVFKLVQALIIENKNENVFQIKDGWEKWLLDLTAIATVCDMVPLIGENRLFVKYGQIVFRNTHRDGLKKIIEKARLDKKNISTDDIGFMIGPRINAAARLEDPSWAFWALAKTGQDAIDSGNYLEKLNNRRKYLISKVMKSVWKRLRERDIKEIIVLGDKEWPLGILGLISGKISDKYKKPSFVWSQAIGSEKVLKGSCRSGGKYDIHSLMSFSSEEFMAFGGHSVSGGFEIKESKIHFLESSLIKKIEKTKKIIEEKIIIDAEISLDDVNLENYKEIKKLEPYGIGNQKPHFFFREIEIFAFKEFGKESNHLELGFKNSRGIIIKAIAFYYKENWESLKLSKGIKINMIATLELNRWNGFQSLRLKIEDIF